MPTDAEYEAALAEVESFAEDFSLQTERSEDIETEDGDTTTQILLEEDNTVVIVVGEPEARYFPVVYPFNLVGAIAEQIDESEIRRDLDDTTPDDTDGEDESAEPQEDPCSRLASQLLAEADDDTLDSFARAVRIVTSTPQTDPEVFSGDEFRFAGFYLTGAIYPYEPDFGFGSLCDCVQAVMNVGRRGQNYVQSVVGVHHPDETESGQYELSLSVDPIPGRTRQESP